VLIVDDHPGFRAQARALLVAGAGWILGAEWVSIHHGIPENHFIDAMTGWRSRGRAGTRPSCAPDVHEHCEDTPVVVGSGYQT
jgi:hypothetical protein